MESEMVIRAEVPNASVVFHSAPPAATSRQPKGWPNFLEIRCFRRQSKVGKTMCYGI